MTLSPHASERHVDEAIRLFNFSTMNAIQSGMGMYEIANNDHLTALSCFCIVEGVSRGKFSEVQQVESVIRRRFAVGSSMSEMRLKDELLKLEFSQTSAIVPSTN
jgi:DNA replication licensing factor MCM5